MTVIAVLGTGLMGAPMARNLLKAGFGVRAWNRSIAKAEALVPDGAVLCHSAFEAVQGADFVLTMLSDGVATGELIFDASVTGALKPGAVWIDMSSTKPDDARTQGAHLLTLDHDHLDAPVSGGTKGAEGATLAIMVGGESAAFERARPVFEAMGRAVLVGPSGAGQLSKLANQTIVAVTIGAVAEATLLLEQGGADPAAVREALKGGFADSVILQQHGDRMSRRDFDPGGLTKFQVKDLNNVLDEARDLALELPITQHIRDRFAHFMDHMDGGDRDHSGLFVELLHRNKMSEK